MNLRRATLAGGAVIVGAGLVGGILLTRTPTPSTAADAPRFALETASSGISHRYDGGVTASVGGGVAVLDCNDDGLPDLYLAGGDGPAALYRNDGSIGGPLHFSPVDEPAAMLADVSGAYPIDIDGDGRTDLVVLRSGENVILRGLGGCRFERANEAIGFDGATGLTTAFSATWEGDAHLPTLAFGHYLGLGANGTPTSDCASSTMLRPSATATTYADATVVDLVPGYCSLSMLFSDWDRSGRRDLRVTNDRNYYADGMDQLWRIEPGIQPRLYTADDGWVSMQIFGMGIASQDVTGDGYPEVYLTSQGDNKLQTLTTGPSHPTYRDIALRRGVLAAQPYTGGDALPSTAWHPEFADVNNDGFLDLFVSKGNVNAQTGYATRDPSNLFIGQPDGTFTEGAEAAGIVSFERARGAALVDFNLDGLLDVVLVNFGADTMLWRNTGSGTAVASAPMGHWVAIRLRTDGPNRDAIGAWVDTRIGDLVTQREVTIGGGHVSGELGWLHLGLGPAANADVRVHWPDGQVGPWIRLDASEFAIIEQGGTEALRWLPGGT